MHFTSTENIIFRRGLFLDISPQHHIDTVSVKDCLRNKKYLWSKLIWPSLPSYKDISSTLDQFQCGIFLVSSSWPWSLPPCCICMKWSSTRSFRLPTSPLQTTNYAVRGAVLSINVWIISSYKIITKSKI